MAKYLKIKLKGQDANSEKMFLVISSPDTGDVSVTQVHNTEEAIKILNQEEQESFTVNDLSERQHDAQHVIDRSVYDEYRYNASIIYVRNSPVASGRAFLALHDDDMITIYKTKRELLAYYDATSEDEAFEENESLFGIEEINLF